MTASRVRLTQGSQPGSPPTNTHEVFIGADGHLKKIDSAGTVTDYEPGVAFVSSVTDTASVDLTVALGALSAALTATGVAAGTYGSLTQVPSLIIDAQGRITGASVVTLSSASLSDFTEAAQDAVGAALTDTSTIDLTYNDGAGTISGDVKPLSLDNSHIAAGAAIEASKLAVSATFSEQYGFPTSGDTFDEAFSKLAWSQALQNNTVSADFTVPSGHSWIREETTLSGTTTITLESGATLRLI